MRRNTREIRKLIWMSFKKWVRIYYRRGVDLGTDNCALCDEYFACTDCPVEIAIDEEKDDEGIDVEGCGYTPYKEWKIHHKLEHGKRAMLAIHCPECREIAGKEMRFLGALFLEYFKEARHINKQEVRSGS